MTLSRSSPAEVGRQFDRAELVLEGVERLELADPVERRPSPSGSSPLKS